MADLPGWEPPPGLCWVKGCDALVDPSMFPGLCDLHRDLVDADQVDEGLMDPDDFAHDRGFITDAGESWETFS